jgi:hypothetical protein
MSADGAWCGILLVLSLPTLLVAVLLKGRLPGAGPVQAGTRAPLAGRT